MKNANTKSRVSSVSKSRASSVSKLRARLLTSWAAVSALAASLLFIGLLTGCPHNQPPAKPVDPAAIFRTDGHGKITGYKCAKEELPAYLVIPAKIGNEEIKEIDQYAFEDCTGLGSVHLPASLTQIGKLAFAGCTGLTRLTIDSANATYKTEGNILYNKAGTTLIFAAGGLTSANILNTVITIDGHAFNSCTGLKSITLPVNLTQIGEYAFRGCTGLRSISLPAHLTKIGFNAFSECTGLTSIRLPASLTKIDWGAFSDCEGLTSAVFEDTNGWKVYAYFDYSSTPTPISSSDLDNVATAAKYLREKNNKGGYCDKYWKKN